MAAIRSIDRPAGDPLCCVMAMISSLRQRFAMLGERTFALLFIGTLLSSTGSAMVPVVLSFALFGQGAGIGQVSAVLAAETLPMVLLTLLGGVLADWVPPRRIMLGADMLRCVAQAALAVLLLAGPIRFSAVLGLAAIVGAGTALEGPGRNRLLIQIVAMDRLSGANALLVTGSSIGSLFGPVLGGLLMAGAGAGWAIALDSVSYAASAACLLAIRAPLSLSVSDEREPSVLSSLHAGWGEFISRRWVWSMVGLFTLLHLLSWGPVVVLGALDFAHRPNGALEWGTLLSLMGAGIVLGGLLALWLQPARPIQAVLLWLLVYPLVPASLALGLPFAAQAVCFLLSGIEIANVNILWETTLQRTIPSERLSRVSAYDQLGSFCLLPLGYVLAGPAASALGIAGTLWLGAGVVATSTLALLAMPDVRRAGVVCSTASMS